MTDCPNETGSIFALVLLIAYIIVLNILLINLLVAIFRYLMKGKLNKNNIFSFCKVKHMKTFKKKLITYGNFNDIP
jgi:hypothetical protein